MATVDRPVSVAEQRAWDVFNSAIDPALTDTSVPAGAAIIAADAPDLDTWKRRYEFEGRDVVIVDSDQGSSVLKAHAERALVVMIGAAIVAAIAKGLGKVRISA